MSAASVWVGVLACTIFANTEVALSFGLCGTVIVELRIYSWLIEV
jgi:hypothetical protein